MLTTLVLDIGNVICEWNPEGLIASACPDPSTHPEAHAATIGHPDWLDLDRGVLTMEEAISRAQARTSLAPESIALVYTNLCESLVALPETMAAMHRARAQDVPIYILSNMQVIAWEYLEKTFDCWAACAGVCVSCDTGFIKPEPEIFHHLCERFSLTPEHCVFVDDMANNIAAARAFGLQGVQLTDRYAGGKVIDELAARIVAGRG
jgi:putative hydrolase of the HAD superfamily